MGLLLFKFLPYLWPLLKEFLEGKKDHPYFKDGVRAKSKAKVFVIILLLLVLAVGNWAYDLHTQNAELEKQIAEQNAKPTITASSEQKYSRDHIDLLMCKRDNEALLVDVKVAQAKLEEERLALKTCSADLAWELANRVPATVIPPSRATPRKPTKPVGDDVQKRLDDLSKKEGNGNAPP